MYYDLGMMTVSEMCDALGRKAMAARLGVSKAAISNACSDNIFSAGWYGVLADMCGEIGIDCPLDLFNFRAPVADSTHEAERSASSPTNGGQ
ncbi:hypothetical protein [Roseovarius amoyensis]|uniref:hypothetical protein n=1 Tax=Roseovarius amoyensis TaxID=2211448 RepID=UPI000DBE75AE|nr:hypothetical protein [Roseovarius amoyensis]